MSTTSPRCPSRVEADAREARRRERFANLAMIAPTPEMVRRVLELAGAAPMAWGDTAR